MSPVPSAANYPPSIDADTGADLPTTDVDEETEADVVREPATALMEMDTEKELVPTIVKTEVDSMEQPVTDKEGEVSHASTYHSNSCSVITTLKIQSP